MMTPTPQRLRGPATVALTLWWALCGCFVFPSPNPDPPPPFVDEGCSNDHTDYWKPSEHVEIWAEGDPADESCNEIGFFAGSGFQGPGVFHIEPIVALTFPPNHQPYAITYEVRDLDGERVTSIGYEMYPSSDDLANGMSSDHPQLQFDEQWRGKNLRVTATVTFFDERSIEYEETAEAALYLGHEN